jgi:hypothetical protein
VYFPWNPLEHLVVEGRLYHFEYGVYDRILAGYSPSFDHFVHDIPPHSQLICYPPETSVGARVTLKYLKEFRERVYLQELPNWECYRRSEEPLPPTDISSHSVPTIKDLPAAQVGSGPE